MNTRFFLSIALGMLVGIQVQPAFAQDAAAGRALGVVTNMDADAHQITLKTDTGSEVVVALDAKASFRRVAPGETNLANASPIAVGDIHVGDRVLARGKTSEDQKSVAATLVVVMSQSDIASKQAMERADWDKRGITGIVTDSAGGQITINVRTLQGVTPIVVTPEPNAIVRRYAPDSVKFADAKPAKLGDIKKGDQVRARGDKTPDGMKMTAEEIVSGQFKMIAGLVTGVDAQENLVRITNLETKKPMTVRISADSSAKRLQPQLAQVIANRLHGVAEAPPPAGAEGAAGPGGRGGQGGGGQAGGGRGGAAGGRGGAGDLQQMIDRTPTMALSELMTGQAVIVSSTVGLNADQVTAITLLAGVEPILTKPGTREMALGDWNMGGGDLGGFGN